MRFLTADYLYPLYINPIKEGVLQISDKVFIISDGQIVSSGKPQEIVKDSQARKIYFGDTY